MTATYDIHGHTPERVVNNPDGTLKWRVSWAGRSMLDAQGRETERVTFNTNGEVTRRTAYQYDSNGNVTKVITYDMGKVGASFCFAR
jgi:YD repeat-containing protein